MRSYLVRNTTLARLSTLSVYLGVFEFHEQVQKRRQSNILSIPPPIYSRLICGQSGKSTVSVQRQIGYTISSDRWRTWFIRISAEDGNTSPEILETRRLVRYNSPSLETYKKHDPCLSVSKPLHLRHFCVTIAHRIQVPVIPPGTGRTKRYMGKSGAGSTVDSIMLFFSASTFTILICGRLSPPQVVFHVGQTRLHLGMHLQKREKVKKAIAPAEVKAGAALVPSANGVASSSMLESEPPLLAGWVAADAAKVPIFYEHLYKSNPDVFPPLPKISDDLRLTVFTPAYYYNVPVINARNAVDIAFPASSNEASEVGG